MNTQHPVYLAPGPAPIEAMPLLQTTPVGKAHPKPWPSATPMLSMETLGPWLWGHPLGTYLMGDLMQEDGHGG